MPKPIPPRPLAMPNRSGSKSLPLRGLSSLVLCAVVLSAAPRLAAQASATAPAPAANPVPAPTHRPVHRHKSSSAIRAKAKPDATAIASAEKSNPVDLTKPILPTWPANDKPTAAAVTWDSHGLRIEAANSSLKQILEAVSTATGAEIQGMDSDQRVFGAYGPGQARDVLSQLLQGSGYNILMIGDQGQGAPRQIVLTARSAADSSSSASKSAPNSSADEDTEAEEPQQPATPSTIRPGFGPSGNPHSPQHIMDPMQQERQQTEQQPQQQQQPQGNNPQN